MSNLKFMLCYIGLFIVAVVLLAVATAYLGPIGGVGP